MTTVYELQFFLQIWQCGGRVETSPCSHVAHVFRKSSPYTFPGGVNQILYSNLARAALVWMDEWKEFFFKMNPGKCKPIRFVFVLFFSVVALRNAVFCFAFHRSQPSS